MVKIIIFLIFIKTVLCFKYENTVTDHMGARKLMATLEFEDGFQSIKTWKITTANQTLNILEKTMCYVNKDSVSVICYCDSRNRASIESFGTCISPLFILDSIHKWGGSSDTRHEEIDGFTKNSEVEQNNRLSVENAIESVLHTFISRRCNDDGRVATNTSIVVCKQHFLAENCTQLPDSYGKVRYRLNTTKLKTQKFPQFAFGSGGSILLFSLHHELRDIHANQTLLLGIVPFNFWGNRAAFSCVDDRHNYEECDDTELKRRFQCAMEGAGSKPFKPVGSYSTNSAKNIESRHSTDFRIETIYEFLLFLALFVIPFVALCIYHSIPEQVDQTPLDPAQFSEVSDVQILSRCTENFEDE